MTLKTLKDLKHVSRTINFYDEKVVRVSELKAEAIKWVREYNKEIKAIIESGEINNELIKSDLRTNCYEVVGKRKALVEFFNITEEELKK